jgi:large subunit ribosomal protein L17
MRHRNGQRQLSRSTSHRRALLRNMATSFIKFERFETTVQKAKELRPVVERLITLGKVDSLAARRQAYGYLTEKSVVHKLFAEVGPRCSARNGGYTRIVRTRFRHGDAAEMAVIELVDKATGDKPSKKTEAKPTKAAPKKAATKKAAPKKAAKAPKAGEAKKAKAPAKKKAASKEEK